MPPNENMTSMPNTYDNNIQQNEGFINKAYFKTIPGIIRCSEMVNCCVCLITATVWETTVPLTGGGWLNFVTIVSLIFVLVLFVFEIFRIHQKLINLLPTWATIELVTFTVMTVCWLIAAIVAAANGNKHSSIGASAFFAFVGTGLFGTDTYFAFQTYRATPRGSASGTSGQPAGTATPTGIPDPAMEPGSAY